jgi:hypothetical protein
VRIASVRVLIRDNIADSLRCDADLLLTHQKDLVS